MRWIGLLGLALAACGGDADGTDTPADHSGGATPTGPVTVGLGIDLDADLIPTMAEPAVGVFRGSVFAEDQATSFGPIEGAVSLQDFTTEPLDFGTAGGTLTTTTELGPLDPQILWVLGCFDGDDNDCDAGDPITVPNENKFQVDATTTTLTLTLSLLSP
jgi:hypothetical protein